MTKPRRDKQPERDRGHAAYDPDNGGFAMLNGWRPERETLEAWRARRSAVWRRERDRVLAGRSPI